MAFGDANRMNVVLGLDDQMSSKLDAAGNKLVGFAERGRMGMLRLGGFAVAAAAAMYSIDRMVKSVHQYAEEIRILSDRTGLATDDVQKLRYAAQKEHVDIEQLSFALSRLTVAVGKAGEGNKMFQEALSGLNIELIKSDGTMKNQLELLLDIADAVKDGKASYSALTNALELLGVRGGARLIPFLKQGREGILANMREMEKWGIMTERQLAIQDKLHTAMLGLNSSMQNVKNMIVSEFTPALSESIMQLAELGRWIATNTTLFEQLGLIITIVFKTLQLGLQMVIAPFEILSAIANDISIRIGRIIESLGYLIHNRAMQEWGKGVAETAEEAMVKLVELQNAIGYKPITFKTPDTSKIDKVLKETKDKMGEIIEGKAGIRTTFGLGEYLPTIMGLQTPSMRGVIKGEGKQITAIFVVDAKDFLPTVSRFALEQGITG